MSFALTLSPPTTYIYVFSVVPLWAQPRIYTWEARRAFFHLENARGRFGCMKHSLWPKKSSWKNNSNDTKNEMENRILPSVVLSAKFCKKHRCISGRTGHIVKNKAGTERVNVCFTGWRHSAPTSCLRPQNSMLVNIKCLPTYYI